MAAVSNTPARTWLRRISVAVIGLLAGGLAAAWVALGDRSLPLESTKVVVERGETLKQISRHLRSAGVVRSSVLFYAYLRLRPALATVQAGEYQFPAHLSMREVVERLAAGGQPLAVWVTIPEGYTARQIGHRLASFQLVDAGEFLRLVREQALVLGGVRTTGLEGYLFPDTYLIPRETTVAAIISQMTSQFLKRLPPHYEAIARRLGYSVPQIITIASLIEREAKVEGERRLMAGVYYNRLRRTMPLEVDATIEYALPTHKTELSYEDLKIDSPYNTYTHSGLPPTPIANPGRRSILAAFSPERTEYLYYVLMGHGRHHFSTTLSEQRAAEEKYLR